MDTYDLCLSGEHSKITLNTQNVFIESTATDLHKVTFRLNERRFKSIVLLDDEMCSIVSRKMNCEHVYD